MLVSGCVVVGFLVGLWVVGGFVRCGDGLWVFRGGVFGVWCVDVLGIVVGFLVFFFWFFLLFF